MRTQNAGRPENQGNKAVRPDAYSVQNYQGGHFWTPITPIMGSTLHAYPQVEAINGLYKAEVIHRLGPWKNMESVEWQTLKWVDWYNNRRLLEPIGNIPPAEAEEKYYAQKADLDMVA